MRQHVLVLKAFLGRERQEWKLGGFCFEGLQEQCDNHALQECQLRIDVQVELSQSFVPALQNYLHDVGKGNFDQGRSMMGYVAPPPGLEQVGVAVVLFPPLHEDATELHQTFGALFHVLPLTSSMSQ